MSRRLAAQQAGSVLARRQLPSEHIGSRCFTTSLVSKQDQRSKKRDANLRHAISLYHISDQFFPIRSKSSTSSQSGEELDERLDVRVRRSILGKTTTQSYINSVDSPLDMKTAYTTTAQKNYRDETQFGSVYSSSNSTNHSADQLFPSHSNHQRPAPINDLQAPLPPVDDREAVQRYIAEVAKKTADRGVKAMNDPDFENLDSRGLEVRDALFGTVRGSQPGLEVLRERVKERERMEAEEQGREGKSEQ